MNPERLLDALTPSETRSLIAALERRDLVSRVAAATEDTLLAELSPEIRARAEAARTAMSAKVELNLEDVGIVPVRDDDGTTKVVVLLASGNGLKQGSWDDIVGAREAGAFRIDVDGSTVDVGSGMTWRAYETLVRRAKTLGLFPLPDSRELTEQSEQPWTCTLLTGEATDGERVPFAFVNDDEPGRSWGDHDYLGGLRFRPAVLVR